MTRWIIALLISICSVQTVGATSDSVFRQEIAPRECTIDTLNTGVSQSTTLQPEACQPLVKKSGTLPESLMAEQETSVAERARFVAARAVEPEDPQPGDQGMFENTIAEPLASWLGIGAKEAPPPVRLAMTSAAFVAVMGVVVDAGFFGLAYTQAVWSGLRRVTGRSVYALLRAFFPRRHK